MKIIVQNRMLKCELWKACHNKRFITAMIIGCGLALVDAGCSWYSVRDLRSGYNSHFYMSHEGFSLFVQWMATSYYNIGSILFYCIWPILAALPYGGSFYVERKHGVSDHIIIRAGRKEYCNAKLTAVFISGGCITAIPVLVNLLVLAMFCPYCVPSVTTSINAIFNGWFGASLYYSYPWIYALLWVILHFIWGGTIAELGIVLGTRPRLQAIVILCPFLLLIIWDGVYNMILAITRWNLELSPLRLIIAGNSNANPLWAELVLLLSLWTIIHMAARREVVLRELR